MDANTAQINAQFLQRVELKGSEVEAFNTVMASLVSIVNAEAPGTARLEPTEEVSDTE